MKEPSYVREARFAQQRFDKRNPVQLEIGGLMAEGFDFSKRYKVEGYGGIAWHCIGHEMIRDEDYEWSGIEYENRERVVCIMVGDDTPHTFEVEELTPLDDDEYCLECGQIGCKANG